MGARGWGEALVALVVGVTAWGCGASSPPTPPPSCLRAPSSIETALRSAPGAVRLADGARLSDCVGRARSEADLEGVGLTLTQVSDDLRRAAARTDTKALQLGYLIGAARRGASRNPGLQAELVHRLEQDATLAPSARAAALQRGLAAGQRRG